MKYLALAAIAAVCLLASGCKQKKVAAAPVPAPPPIATTPPIQIPTADALEAQRRALEELPPMAEPESAPEPENTDKPKRPVRRQPRPVTPTTPVQSAQTPPTTTTPQPVAPTQTASAGPPDEASVIGQLSTGGDTGGDARRQTAETIDALLKRTNGLSPAMVQKHHPAVNQVRDFLAKAQDALKSGDVDGARNLATKAKVLLDDMQ